MADACATPHVALDVPLHHELIECRDDGVARHVEVRRQCPGRRQPKTAREAARQNPVAKGPVDLARQGVLRAGIERDQNGDALWSAPLRHAADDACRAATMEATPRVACGTK